MSSNITYTTGNLLEADVDAIVNTVNTVGVMGKGIALQFKQAFPENFAEYASACKRGEVHPGAMFVTETGALTGPKYLINFPTKRDWRAKARIEDIKSGLAALIRKISELNIRSIAVPPLGCGNGGLDWDDVRPLIEAEFATVPDVRVLAYTPNGAPDPSNMRYGTSRPKMTLLRAAVLCLIDRYAVPGYRVTMLEIQKLVYFLKAAGEPIELKFEKAQFGPYAETLHHVLQRMESHFVSGYGDRSRGIKLQVLPEALAEAEEFLERHKEVWPHIDKVYKLIDGFETPYGLELLATIHFLANESDAVKYNPGAAVKGVQDWSPRKKETFSPEHIGIAWESLHEGGWI